MNDIYLKLLLSQYDKKINNTLEFYANQINNDETLMILICVFSFIVIFAFSLLSFYFLCILAVEKCK